MKSAPTWYPKWQNVHFSMAEQVNLVLVLSPGWPSHLNLIFKILRLLNRSEGHIWPFLSRFEGHFIGYSALPGRSWDHFIVISSDYLGDMDFILWNSYLRFIP